MYSSVASMGHSDIMCSTASSICSQSLRLLSASIIMIIIIIISFMQGIYTYIPETNCVPREYSVAAILLLLFMVLISLVSVLNYYYYYHRHHHHHHLFYAEYLYLYS